MNDIMLDLETMGVAAGCPVISIGAVAFDEFSVDPSGFYTVISLSDCEAEGLKSDESTKAWWAQQGEAASKILSDPTAVSLGVGLSRFAGWLGGFESPRVWGNGADFDLPILGAAYNIAGHKIPWKPYNGRCYRTVKNQFKDVKLVRSGTHHNALDDARSQAEHLVAICQQRGWNLA